MEELLKSTTAYKILYGDRAAGRLSHAYLLHFQDAKNLRAALVFFSALIFGAERGGALYRRIEYGNHSDFTLYPQDGKKITADGVSEIITDSAMRPVEGSIKLYSICNFETASAMVQNKLLKSLEEPLEGVHYLLGATSLAPVLDTVKSRVKILEIPPFSEDQILSALNRKGDNPLNARAAQSAGGCLGFAENILSGGWFKEVSTGAEEICSTLDVADVGAVAQKYGETKFKKEMLSEMQRLYFTALTQGGRLAAKISKPALIYALEKINGANADVRFNAYFQGLLYDFMLGVIKENDKWRKL